MVYFEGLVFADADGAGHYYAACLSHTLNRRLQDRYILDHSGEFSLPNVVPPTTETDLGELRNMFLAGIDSNWQTSVDRRAEAAAHRRARNGLFLSR